MCDGGGVSESYRGGEATADSNKVENKSFTAKLSTFFQRPAGLHLNRAKYDVCTSFWYYYYYDDDGDT